MSRPAPGDKQKSGDEDFATTTSGGGGTAATVIKPGTHVRSRNTNYRALGVGRVQKVKDSQCKVEFNPSVFSRPPFPSQNYILRLGNKTRQLKLADQLHNPT